MTGPRSAFDVASLAGLLGGRVDGQEGVFEGFEAPSAPPQLESQDLTIDIRELMYEAPKWHSSMVAELEHHCRMSVAVRSAIMFSMEIARVSELQLRRVTKGKEIAKLQGNVEGLEKFAETLLVMMENNAPPKDEEDVEEHEPDEATDAAASQV